MNIIDLYKKHSTVINISAGVLLAAIIVWKRRAIWYYIKLPIRMANDALNTLELEKLHPKAKPIFATFIDRIKKLGYDVTITSSYRTFQKQAQLKKENSANAAAGRSFHNYGLACDINLEKDGKFWKKATSVAEWNKTGVPELAKSLGLLWGGTYKNYLDAIHFEYRVKPIDQLYAQAIKQFGSIEKAEGNKVNI